MKFWVYAVDWRNRAVSIVADVGSEEEGHNFIAKHFAEASKEQAQEHADYFSFAVTPVSLEMEFFAKKFVRPGESITEGAARA